MTSFSEGKQPHPVLYCNEKAHFGPARYNVTKLLNVLLAREVGKLAGDGVVVNSVDPGGLILRSSTSFELFSGLCHSSLFRSLGPLEYAPFPLSVHVV